jgi:hypothetical protein
MESFQEKHYFVDSQHPPSNFLSKVVIVDNDFNQNK